MCPRAASKRFCLHQKNKNKNKKSKKKNKKKKKEKKTTTADISSRALIEPIARPIIVYLCIYEI